MMIEKKALSRLFVDALDELEITYDVYNDIERYRCRCVHVMQRLSSDGITHGNALVLGKNEQPFSMVLEKLGFKVLAFSLFQELESDGKTGSEGHPPLTELVSGLPGWYDIIIIDDILQYIPYPAALLSTLKDHVIPGGVLTVTTPNVARGASRMRLLRGKNIYPLSIEPQCSDDNSEENALRLTAYREYSLSELEGLMTDAGLKTIHSEFIIEQGVNANMWPPMSMKEYSSQILSLAIQKAFPRLRNYLYVAGRRPLAEAVNKGPEEPL